MEQHLEALARTSSQYQNQETKMYSPEPAHLAEIAYRREQIGAYFVAAAMRRELAGDRPEPKHRLRRLIRRATHRRPVRRQPTAAGPGCHAGSVRG